MTVGEGVGVGVGVGGGVTAGVGVGVAVGSTGLNTGFGLGFGAAFTATPLFHTSLVPDLTQVNFFPADIDVTPTFVHFAPALTAALAENCVVARIRRQAIATNRQLLARIVNKFAH